MTYQLIGAPEVEVEYSDEYETAMVCDLQREDGETGDVWIVAGVPGSLRGSSDAARTQSGYQSVHVFGDCPDHWCPASFRPADGDYAQVAGDVIAACRVAALHTHRQQARAEAGECTTS